MKRSMETLLDQLYIGSQDVTSIDDRNFVLPANDDSAMYQNSHTHYMRQPDEKMTTRSREEEMLVQKKKKQKLIIQRKRSKTKSMKRKKRIIKAQQLHQLENSTCDARMNISLSSKMKKQQDKWTRKAKKELRNKAIRSKRNMKMSLKHMKHTLAIMAL